MKFTATYDPPTMDVTVQVTDGTVIREEGTDAWFTVSTVELAYSQCYDGPEWDILSPDDVVLSGYGTVGGRPEWRSTTLPRDEFSTMDTSHRWLFDLIDAHAPKGRVTCPGDVR